MKYKLSIILIIVLLFQTLNGQTETLSFNSLDSVFAYSEENSSTIKTNKQQTLLAKWEKIAAKTGLINFKMLSSFNITNNYKQAVTFLPAEAFGGAPGTFKRVETGTPYVENFTITPQIDIINFASWYKLKSANINSELTDVNNLLVKKTLFESIAAAYYNIISLKAQVEFTKKSLASADTLLQNMKNKYAEGIIRKQDLNEAEINNLALTDKLKQLEITLEKQYFSLKILCDIPSETNVVINEEINYKQFFEKGLEVNNNLQYKYSLLKVKQAEAEIRTNQFLQLPKVSLVFYDSWQHNSASKFFDNNTPWINSQYISLRLSLPFPDINRYALTQKSKINKTILEQNAEHTRLTNDLQNKQMVLDYKKAYSQLITNKQIYNLKKENYRMSVNQFNMSILPPDKLITDFNDMITSMLNYTSSFSNLLYTKSTIKINNTIK
jgi:OMF family outer membrane factor